MPVPSFLSSFADKAQSALNASPLAQHLPSGHRPTSPDAAAQPPANEAAAQGGHRNHTLDAIQYQLRAFGQQYASTTPVQKMITISKGVAIDFDSVSRDAKSQSKELYTWGQSEPADLKDVSDRLAYLNFVQGSLASSLALKLDSARTPLKALRDAETAITPRRNIRAGLQNQIARLEHDQQKGMEKKIQDFKDQLRKAELEDQAQENEIELLKRKAIRESEQLKWDAIREYGEKLVLLSQASTPIIQALPTLPPTPANPYTGGQATGAARASLQRALDNYKTGHINLPPQVAGSDLGRSDTRSFGESHASELSSISSDITSGTQPGIPLTPPPTANRPLSSQTHPPSAFKAGDSTSSVPEKSSPPINPSNLNQTPAPIPNAGISSPAAPVPIVASDPVVNLPAVTPTVAETGVPVSAGPSGPGPASGSLRDIKAASPNAGPQSGGLSGNEQGGDSFGSPAAIGAASSMYETAEEEKKRLQREDREKVLAQPQPITATTTATASPSPPATSDKPYETADEEKKRLEREDRDKILRQGGGAAGDSSKKDDDLPPYQDY